MSDPSFAQLAELARAHGVATEYWDWLGKHVVVADATLVAVLGALGVNASSPESIANSLRAQRDRPWTRVLPSVVVCRRGAMPWVPVHVPHGAEIRAQVHLEDGVPRELRPVAHWVPPREIDGVLTGEATLEIPGDLPLGWHTLQVRISAGQEQPVRTASTQLVITPARLELPPTLVRERAWGLMAQLYQVRSRRSWGIGDLADLADLGSWGHTRLGADFVLVNPLHAAQPVAPTEPSPYLPTTRRFVSPLYIRVEEVLEVGYLPAAERQLLERHAGEARRLNTADRIDRDAVWAAKRSALRNLFHAERNTARENAFRAFCEREGEGLLDFATWSAISERHALPWPQWPLELQDAHGEAVAALRKELAQEVDFHRWLQWVVRDQLAATQRTLREAGMRIGVVQDLAVGVHPRGAESWWLAGSLAAGVTVGAPADQYNQLGQDWSQPPWSPIALAEAAYRPYRDMVRGALRDAGALRVDHVMGLFRLWWVPEGMPASAGTYVRYDHEAMVGILALEAYRAGALLIGEDLGTVEPWVREYLQGRGLLGTSILWFERDDGVPRPPESWRQLCLATVTTHDLPPTAAYLAGAHIDLRAELGLLGRPVEVERAEDERDREVVLDALHRRGLLGERSSTREQVEALHRYLAWAPSRLVGVAVADLAQDVRAINAPGTDKEYPNWRLALAGPDGEPMLLEDLMASPWARRLARAVAQR